MSMPLPLGNFHWLSDHSVQMFNVESMISVDSCAGYILEVDLEYPEELHDTHSSFPLAPVNLDITDELLSPYSRQCLNAMQEQQGKPHKEHKATKLTSTFLDRKKYLVHGLNLKFYLEQGMVLKKIHRIIGFRQAPFIKTYIDYCTHRRKIATTETEKTFWKLIVNSLYGRWLLLLLLLLFFIS